MCLKWPFISLLCSSIWNLPLCPGSFPPYESQWENEFTPSRGRKKVRYCLSAFLELKSGRKCELPQLDTIPTTINSSTTHTERHTETHTYICTRTHRRTHTHAGTQIHIHTLTCTQGLEGNASQQWQSRGPPSWVALCLLSLSSFSFPGGTFLWKKSQSS